MMQSKVRRDAYVAAHISNTVASQILMLREAKGWTQTQLAEKSGMRQSRISALEDPNYENVEAATLRRLASAFDVALTIRFIPFSELAGWTATLSPEKLTPTEFAGDSLPAETPSSAMQAPINMGTTKLIHFSKYDSTPPVRPWNAATLRRVPDVRVTAVGYGEAA
jgi:transcriptional regulator with XRE-family HTH domain